MGPRLVRTKSLTKEDPRGWGGGWARTKGGRRKNGFVISASFIMIQSMIRVKSNLYSEHMRLVDLGGGGGCTTDLEFL